MRAILASVLLLGAATAMRAAAISPEVQFFDLAEVRLGAGPFRDAMERDRAYLLSLEPDRFLHTFRLNVKLPSSAQPYGGWEGPDVELRGHSLGHYLSACALMYRSTGDAAFKERIDKVVAALAECQAASPKAGFHEGYLSAFPESLIDRVEAQKGWVWAPWYTLHKIMAGLFDANQLAGNAQAMDILNKMATWIAFRMDKLTPAQIQAELETEHGGMNEVLANIYAITKNPEHLRLAKIFEHAKVFDPLARGEDPLDGLHANTQIPKIIGAAREYELTGEARYEKIAETFWDRVALHRSYVTGGHSDREHFFPVNEFRKHLSPETTETCNTYNMLKLTRHLYSWEPQVQLMDFYERGLYNHILASQDPARGMFVYLLSLEPAHFKTYSTAEDSFWCCVGTGMENHAKYGDTIFAYDGRGLFVNLFIAAELNWRERNLRVTQETQFPESETTRLTIHATQPVDMPLRIRHPAWANGALTISVNGQPQTDASKPGSYAEISRTWRDGDRVEVRFPFALHTEALPGNDDIVAVLYGPIVLAGKLGIDGMPHPYAHDQLDQARYPHPEAPRFVTDAKDWLDHIERVSTTPLLFRTRGLAQPHDVTLAPLFQVHQERYTVYWHVLSPTAYERAQAAATKAAQDWMDLTKSAVDQVVVGETASEGAHAFKDQGSEAGKVAGRSWREANKKAGYFSYELDAHDTTKPMTVVCALDSRDKARTYEILINDKPVTLPAVDNEAPSDLTLARFEATPVNGKVAIRFQAKDEWFAATANVFGVVLVAAQR